MTGRTCSTCRYAEPTVTEEDGPYMQCRRYPPAIVADDIAGRAGQVFPWVEPDDWCGEWQPTHATSGPDPTPHDP